MEHWENHLSRLVYSPHKSPDPEVDIVSDYPFTNDLRDRITDNLNRHPVHKAAPETAARLKLAAVTITLTNHRGGTHFLLTKRAPRLNAHAGQWALPGGRLDPGESAGGAALRELEEELGVHLPPSAILGALDDYQTASGYLISPLILWTGADTQLEPNPAEVAAVYHIPLGDVAAPDAAQFIGQPGTAHPMIRLSLTTGHIHAPTAAILYQFAERALYGRPTRVDRLSEPDWARR